MVWQVVVFKGGVEESIFAVLIGKLGVGEGRSCGIGNCVVETFSDGVCLRYGHVV